MAKEEFFPLEVAKEDVNRKINMQESIQPLNLIRLKAQLRERKKYIREDEKSLRRLKRFDRIGRA